MNKFSHTSLSAYRRCRYRFYLAYVEGFMSPPSWGQVRGTSGHAALGAWYKQETRDEQADEIALQTAWEAFSAECEKTGMAIDGNEFVETENALNRYFPWARKKDKWSPIALEFKFDTKLGENFLTGYIDMIVRERDDIWLVENKFNKRVETAGLDLDAQVTLYMIGAYLSGYNPIGVIYNIVRMGEGKTVDKEPVVRKMLYRNPAGLNAKIAELDNQMTEMRTFTEEGGYIYRNETKDCSWDCPFYMACLSISDSGNGDAVLSRFPRREF